MKSKELYPRVFSRHAGAYKQRLDEVMARGEPRGRLRMIELAAVRPGMRVLDLACGPGTITRLLAKQVTPAGSVVGADLARGMLDLAAADPPPGCWFAVMDMERLGFADSTFDAVVCGHGLQFAPSLGVALGETLRVLKPRGALAASVPASGRDDSIWTAIDRVADRHLPAAQKAIDDHATRATVSDQNAFRQAAIDAGFASATVESVEEEVIWQSAEAFVSAFMSWWQCASRVEALDSQSRAEFFDEAVESLHEGHDGPITTHGRNLVLLAQRS